VLAAFNKIDNESASIYEPSALKLAEIESGALLKRGGGENVGEAIIYVMLMKAMRRERKGRIKYTVPSM